jgi:cystathionine beta-lyase
MLKMTTQYNFDQVLDRQESDCVKWNFFEKDILPMWVADMDFRSPEPVIRALRTRIDHGFFGYPEWETRNTGLMSDLCQVLVERMENLYAWKIVPDDLVFVPGVVVGFNLACHALAAPEGGVFIQTPVYFPMLQSAKVSGSLDQQMELTVQADGTYSVDLDLFKESLSPETRLFILCNPHNPVGKVFRKDELEQMATICLERDITICSDEIHCDLIYSGHRHIPIAALDPEIAQHTITLMAPSKTFNLAGLQGSFAIIQNRELKARYTKSHKGLVTGVNMIALQAALAAYREGNEWLSQLLVYLEANRDYLVSYVRENLPGVKIGIPQGTYLAWLDCREAGIEGKPARFFIEKARVGLSEGEMFGRGGQGFIRLNFGCPRPLLEKGLERMKNALQQLNA